MMKKDELIKIKEQINKQLNTRKTELTSNKKTATKNIQSLIKNRKD